MVYPLFWCLGDQQIYFCHRYKGSFSPRHRLIINIDWTSISFKRSIGHSNPFFFFYQNFFHIARFFFSFVFKQPNIKEMHLQGEQMVCSCYGIIKYCDRRFARDGGGGRGVKHVSILPIKGAGHYFSIGIHTKYIYIFFYLRYMGKKRI